MAIKLEKICMTYNRPVIVNLDMTIDEGEYVAIMGPSGVGKSTILKILALQLRATSGSYKLGEQDVSVESHENRKEIKRNTIGYIDQATFLFDSLTVIENVMLMLSSANEDLDQEYCNLVFKYLDISGKENSYPYELSGGERQRVVIAQNILKKPKILLMDEPTSSLDYINGKKLMELITKLQSRLNLTIVIVTHNTNVAKYVNRTILIKDGQVFANVYKGEDDYQTKLMTAQSAMYRRSV
ncbi:ATP-binding cassette domain-containing protein [Mollicutes bacterium LVI A0078]|nr:ATP-binding cassette domain-containing protein [Mollicutes bacterium LVI A0075]WOO91034.1 ATP-binding cassette domain-containing protein [Mollicutes bacterium LVI A0078]